jgi:hypothetical protein
MEELDANEQAAGGPGYTYFVLRIRRPAAATAPPDALGGLVARLGTGEKRAFGTAFELVAALRTWAGFRPQP